MEFQSLVKFSFLGCVICIPSGAFTQTSMRKRAKGRINWVARCGEKVGNTFMERYRETGIPAGMESPRM